MAANDLIAGVYEGGFKTWEGGLDLAQLLAAALQQQPPPAELGPGSRVMELVGAAAAWATGCRMLRLIVACPPACLQLHAPLARLHCCLWCRPCKQHQRGMC